MSTEPLPTPARPQHWASRTLRALMPSNCWLCAASGDVVCGPCASTLTDTGARVACIRCARLIAASGATDPVCGGCLVSPPTYASAFALMPYRYPADQLVQAAKYNEALPLLRWLGEAMATRVSASAIEVVMPVPLSKERLHERGYNQATEIARALARGIDRPLDAASLVRARHTREQADLPFEERQRNVRGAFAVHSTTAIEGKTIALVDDVMTTGATLQEATRTLKSAGALEVHAWVAARTILN